MAQPASIPFLDLITPHVELEEELVAAFRSSLRKAHFIGGAELEQFERNFAQYCDTRFCVGLASGTDAVRFALMAAGVKSGDAVITVPNTFIATSEGISQAGALPLFVDVDERTYNLDAGRLQQFLEQECYFDAASGKRVHSASERPVTAVVPVHLYGQIAAMDEILEVARNHGLMVIEDSCQAHGAEYFSRKQDRWQKAGSIGVAGAFSFYPGKNLGACGEAGAVTTNDEEMARKIRMLRDHGQSRKYYHDVEGYNGRLDTIQAAILDIKLKHLPSWTEKRQQLAENYSRLIDGFSDVVGPYQPAWSKAVYHLYVVRVTEREQVQSGLAAAGIGTAIHYPIPLHQQVAYKHLGYRSGSFPVAERVAPEILSLPMYPQLSFEQQRTVVEKLKQVVSEAKPAVVSTR
jgi:dTDP-4-amino-4,6-dideoxygalactose transaminase